MTLGKRLILLACLAVAAGVAMFAMQSSASLGDNVRGYAWSSNIGWVKLNNCTDLSNCPAPSYGVNIQPNAPGVVSGYAWSSNIGWVSFESASVAGCPPVTGLTQCDPMVDWTAPSGGLYKMKGWARACSVFASGCNGPLKADIERGGWDGFIALGVTNSGSAANWPGGTGVMVSPTMALSGYAWGSEVVGWMKFGFGGNSIPECSDTIDNADPEDAANPLADEWDPGCHTDGIVDPNNPLLTHDPLDNDETDAASTLPTVSLAASPATFTTTVSPQLTLNATNFTAPINCSVDQGIGPVSMSSTGSNSWTSGTVGAPQISATTTYVATCVSPSGNDSDSATVTKVGGGQVGICGSAHFMCLNGNSINNVTGSSSWTWVCQDVDGDDSCLEPFPPALECADGIDNTDLEDVVEDTRDPGCHTDGNASDPSTYDPTDNDERNKRKPIFIEF